MIRPEDAEFHHGPDSPFDWCETNFFPFCIPEHRISGNFYLLTRPKLGVTMCDVLVQDRIAPAWEDQLYVDNRQHLPCPESLLNYALPNGLTVKAIVPLKHYRLDFIGIDDTEIHLDYHALMEPFDMNDPEMDPLAAPRIGKGWSGTAFTGHYEITCRIIGTARLRGVDFKVDCIDTLDRSWGQRKEFGSGNAIWLHGSFGEALTMHALFGVDPAASNAFGALISGYILEEGKIYGLTKGSGEIARVNSLPMSNIVEVEDVRGKCFRFTAAAVNAAAWAPFPSLIYPQSLMRWNYEGRIGWGIHQDIVSRAYMTRHRAILQTS